MVTPNLPEAAALADLPVATEADMEEAARRIHRRGPRHVLVKGGHLKDSTTDILYDGRAFTRFSGTRVDSRNTHGTGCTLSAAIAAGLAHGRPLVEAIREAKAYVTAAIREGFAAGRGVGGAATLRDRLVAMARTVDDKMPFLEHLGELRVRIMRALVSLLVGTLVALPFSQYLIDWLARPITKLGYELVFTAPAEAFWVQMKVGHHRRPVHRRARHPVAGVGLRLSRPAHAREEVRRRRS